MSSTCRTVWGSRLEWGAPFLEREHVGHTLFAKYTCILEVKMYDWQTAQSNFSWTQNLNPTEMPMNTNKTKAQIQNWINWYEILKSKGFK